MEQPWEHPDWYDLHDTAWTAGSEREPEHYRELLLALPPLDAQDHLVDVGAGTGKLAAQIGAGYPKLGQVTLVEPNRYKLERASARLRKTLPAATINALPVGLGMRKQMPEVKGNILTVGSVFMPMIELRGGTLADGLSWLRDALADTLRLLRGGGWIYANETLAAPWASGSLRDPVRRLRMPELTDELEHAGYENIECVYRFRDRITVRGQKKLKIKSKK
jgi:SAM-dependent methyltransferase